MSELHQKRHFREGRDVMIFHTMEIHSDTGACLGEGAAFLWKAQPEPWDSPLPSSHRSQGLPQAAPSVAQHSDFRVAPLMFTSQRLSWIFSQHVPFRLSEKQQEGMGSSHLWRQYNSVRHNKGNFYSIKQEHYFKNVSCVSFERIYVYMYFKYTILHGSQVLYHVHLTGYDNFYN